MISEKYFKSLSQMKKKERQKIINEKVSWVGSLNMSFQLSVHVTGNCGNKAFPEIPRRFRKRLGNWGNSGIA